MVPNVTKTGHSFKGLFEYLLHDKRQDGEAVRHTSARVGWTETRNLATDDPELAKRIMIATAMQADELKRAAGVKNTGAKSKAAVYHYSLAWHPDEAGRIDRAEMMKAVDGSLAALGAGNRQAVIVCHIDEPQPHVHVIVNRIDPADGRMLSNSNDFPKLEAWALAYRQARGEEQLYCPARQKKADAITAKTRGELVPFVRGQKEASQAFGMAADPDQAMTRLKAKAADLAKRGDEMKARHSREWQGLSAGNRAARSKAFDTAKAKGATVRDTVKAEFKSRWADLFRKQRQERKAFARLDLLAASVTAWRAAQETEEGRAAVAGKGWLRTAFMFVASGKMREAMLVARQTKEQKALAAQQKAAANARWAAIGGERAAALDDARHAFQERRAAIIARQNAEIAAGRKEWRDLTAERDAIAAARPRSSPDRRRQDLESRHYQTAAEIRAAYAETVGKHQASRAPRREGRTRSRSRTGPQEPQP